MKRGEIYYIAITNQVEGSEQRAGRPAVIVSNDKNNENSGTVEVVYMTTQPKKDLPTHVVTRSARTTSTILCEQITTVAASRVGERLGGLTESEMQAVDRALAISLGIDFGEKTCPSDCHGVAPIKRDPTAAQTAELLREAIKVQSERDVYRDLYRELLEHVKGGAVG